MFKNILVKLWSILKKKWVWIPLILIAVVVLIFSASSGKKKTLQAIPVERGTVTLEVSVTGRVKPTQSLDIAFERGGRIASIPVQVGQRVSEGQTLITLDYTDLLAQLAQAQAYYDSQVAKLEQLQKNAQGSGAQSAKADIDLQTKYVSALDTIRDAYSKSNDAVRNQTSDLFNYDEDDSPQVTFLTSDADAKINAGSLRYQSRVLLDAWAAENTTLSANNRADIDESLQKNIARVSTFLKLYDNLEAALNAATGLSDAVQTSYKTNLAAGRAKLNAALAALNSAVQSIASQKTIAESTLDDVAIQKGQVEQAHAQVLYYQSQIAKAIIRAPFEGTVTKIPFSKGEIIQPNVTAISLIGSGKYQIETNVTESDVARIQVGNNARVTLDAYGQDVVFGARVIAIDLSETIIDGVPTYKTTLEFTQNDERILSGLTANIDILSDKKENVLFVPTRVISVSPEGIKTVEVLTADRTSSIKKEIKTGLKGSDGRTEVISGLEEGELVVTE